MSKHCSATLADIENIYLEKPPEHAHAARPCHQPCLSADFRGDSRVRGYNMSAPEKPAQHVTEDSPTAHVCYTLSTPLSIAKGRHHEVSAHLGWHQEPEYPR